MQPLRERGDCVLRAASIVPNINDTRNVPRFYDLMADSAEVKILHRPSLTLN